MASHDVFISYSSADKAAADGVCHGLEARGVRCWMAPRDVIPGSDWQTALLDAISDARVVVLLFTESANTSEHIKREITAAFEGGAVVIPFRLENVAPKGALRYHLTGVHWLDAFSGELDPHVTQLSETIKRVLERAGESRTTPAAAAAIASLSDMPPPAATPVTPPPAATPPSPPPPAASTPPKADPAPVASKPSTPSTPPAAPFGARPASTTAAAAGGIKPWMIIAGVGALALIAVIAVVAMMSGGGGPTPAPATVSTSGSGMQIDLNSRPAPTGGTPLQTLDPNTPPPAPPTPAEPPATEQPAVEEPAPAENPNTYPDGTPMPQDNADSGQGAGFQEQQQ